MLTEQDKETGEMSDELLACPFCGGEGVIVVDHVLGPDEPLFAPMCQHYAEWWENRFVEKYPNGPICQGSAGTNFHTREEAIEAWNRRAQPATGQQGQVMTDEVARTLIDALVQRKHDLMTLCDTEAQFVELVKRYDKAFAWLQSVRPQPTA
jgi:hypothetical protein